MGWLTLIVGIGLSVASAVSYFGSRHWRFDLLSNFRWQLSVALLLCFGIGLIFPTRVWFALLLPMILLNLWSIFPLFTTRWGNGSETDTPLRVMSFNVLGSNRRDAETMEAVRAADADVLIVVEMRPPLAKLLEQTDYPHKHLIPRKDNFGIALLSRHPFDVITVEGERPIIFAKMMVNEQPVHIMSVHPWPPVTRECSDKRDAAIVYFKQLLDGIDTPIIVAGDFNAAVWTHPLRDWERRGLKSASYGFGWRPTWRHHELRVPALPIDHILVSEAFIVTEYTVGDSLGSDHRPIIADLLLRP